MSFAVNVHKLFWLDVAEARSYYECVSVAVADKFETAFLTAYQDIQRNPEAFFNISKNIRRIQVPGFPYQIVYSFKRNTVYILCLHPGRSDKKEWNRRNKE